MPQTIVAVAIGTEQPPTRITSNATIPSWARKYINGFIGAFPHTLGTDYVIDYRQCPAAQLNTLFTSNLQADYILCLSTTVLLTAAALVAIKPIIGMCSHPENYPFGNQNNVCGVSAGRSDDADHAYRNLLRTLDPNLPTATVLNDPNYPPSTDSVQSIHNGGNHPNVVNVSDPTAIQNWITNNANAGSGVLLLPVDWMFGAAQDIIGWTSRKKVLDFWLVTDWVQQAPTLSAFGGYGVPQEKSGHYLAQQVEAIWNGHRPSPVWRTVPQSEREWKASQTRATSAGVTLNQHGGPVIVP